MYKYVFIFYLFLIQPDGQQPAPEVITDTAAPEGEKPEGEEEAPPVEEEPELITKPPQDIWMDYDIFIKCFRYGTRN